MKNNPDKITSQLIDQLAEARKQQGLSHEKLAQMAKVDRSTISLIENKKRIPTILTCVKISEALGISLGEILVSLEKNNKK